MTLNPLANPKGTRLLCELCQKPAFIQCTKCRVTYYCGVEHQKADWLGIHEKICQSLIPLRQSGPFLPSAEERQNRERQLQNKKLHMIDLTRTIGQKLLFEGKHEQAVPAAMQSLRFSIDVYGLASIELVPSYLILGEASIGEFSLSVGQSFHCETLDFGKSKKSGIKNTSLSFGLGRLEQADEYLAQAQWTVLKTPECANAINSKLYRNLGLLYAAKGDYEEALRQLANDIFHASEEFGTYDIRTSGGYFHMGNVFFRQGKMDIAVTLYRQVTDIWYSHLSNIVKVRTRTPPTPKGVGPLIVEMFDEQEDSLDEAQEAEAVQILNSIYDNMREHQSSRKPEDFARVSHALAMLYFILNDISKAKEFGRKAVVASEGLQDDTMSRSIIEFMKNCERVTF